MGPLVFRFSLPPNPSPDRLKSKRADDRGRRSLRESGRGVTETETREEPEGTGGGPGPSSRRSKGKESDTRERRGQVRVGEVRP